MTVIVRTPTRRRLMLMRRLMLLSLSGGLGVAVPAPLLPGSAWATADTPRDFKDSRASKAAKNSSALVFDDVTVIDVEHGTHLPHQRVVIVGNRIRAMGAAKTTAMPAHARVVPATGKYLIPGLWDMHTHSQTATDIFYPMFLANGVTGIRDGWSVVPFDILNKWRREIVAGTRIGPPRQILVGSAIDELTPCVRQEGDGHVCVADPADARHVVDSLKALGVDMIKTYDIRNPAIYFAIAAESRTLHIPFGGHLDFSESGITAIAASDSGARILDHVNTAGDLDVRCLGKAASVEQCASIANHFRRNNTWFVPTYMVMSVVYPVKQAVAGKGRAAFGPASQAILARFAHFTHDFWSGKTLRLTGLRDTARIAQRTVQRTVQTGPGGDVGGSGGSLRLIHQVGVPILAGTDNGARWMLDVPPGFTLQAELALYVAEGMSTLEALQSATLNPAKMLHGTDSLGTVAVGKLADLVLLDADPLVDITNTQTIEAVVANGRYFDRPALDQLLIGAQHDAK